MIKAKKDNYIRDLVKDVNYKIYKNGVVLTKITVTGKVGKKWRKLCLNLTGGSIHIRYKNKKLLLHRIIFQKYGGELDEYKVINHKDSNPYNNHIRNLEQITYGENQIHRFQKNTPNYSNSKINFLIAQEIREKQKKGWTNKELREKYKLSKSSISGIVNNKNWLKQEPKKENKDYRCKDKTRIVNWSEIEKIEEFYKNKPYGMSVDHIIPLHNPDICGLHVLDNLQYLSEKDNKSKGNSFDYTKENNSWKKTLISKLNE